MPARTCVNTDAHARHFCVSLSLNPSLITPRLKHRCLESAQTRVRCQRSWYRVTMSEFSNVHTVCFPQKTPTSLHFEKVAFQFQSMHRYLFSAETLTSRKFFFIFIEHNFFLKKGPGPALCPLELNWPQECLMKWNKLLWLSSNGCRVGGEPESRREGPRIRTLSKRHFTTRTQKKAIRTHKHTQILPSVVLPRSVFTSNHNRAGR